MENKDKLGIEQQQKGKKAVCDSVCDQKKSPNLHKSCPKMIALQKLQILTPLQKLPKNVENWSKFIVAKGFKKLPKVQKITQSGHTGSKLHNDSLNNSSTEVT